MAEKEDHPTKMRRLVRKAPTVTPEPALSTVSRVRRLIRKSPEQMAAEAAEREKAAEKEKAAADAKAIEHAAKKAKEYAELDSAAKIAADKIYIKRNPTTWNSPWEYVPSSVKDKPERKRTINALSARLTNAQIICIRAIKLASGILNLGLRPLSRFGQMPVSIADLNWYDQQKAEANRDFNFKRVPVIKGDWNQGATTMGAYDSPIVEFDSSEGEDYIGCRVGVRWIVIPTPKEYEDEEGKAWWGVIRVYFEYNVKDPSKSKWETHVRHTWEKYDDYDGGRVDKLVEEAFDDEQFIEYLTEDPIQWAEEANKKANELFDEMNPANKELKALETKMLKRYAASSDEEQNKLLRELPGNKSYVEPYEKNYIDKHIFNYGSLYTALRSDIAQYLRLKEKSSPKEFSDTGVPSRKIQDYIWNLFYDSPATQDKTLGIH